MTISNQDRSIKNLIRRAKAGDIRALSQMAENYAEGRYVDADKLLSDKYKERSVSLFRDQYRYLSVSNIKLTNFRAFEDCEFDFRSQTENHQNLVVLIGENGAGKTAALDAVSYALSWIIARIRNPGGKGTPIEQFDIRSPGKYASIVVNFSVHKKLHFDVELSKRLEGTNVSRKNNLQDIALLADLLGSARDVADDFCLPVMAYYGTGRANDICSRDISDYTADPGDTSWSFLNGYEKALTGTADFKLFFRWFKDLEDIRNAENVETNYDVITDEDIRTEYGDEILVLVKNDAELRKAIGARLLKRIRTNDNQAVHFGSDRAGQIIDVVSSAIQSFLPSFGNLRVARYPELDMLIDKDGLTLSVLQLSQGEKSLMALIADIARRLVLLNPATKNPLAGSGIVLIDEIELHLHPAWQQTVVPNLLKTFPNIQFLLTTHSPQILTLVSNECVRELGHGSDGLQLAAIPKPHTYGWPSGDVLHSVMRVDPQPAVPEKEELDALTSLIEQHGSISTDVEQRLRNLSQSLGENHPQILRIQRSIRRMKAQKS